MTFRLFGERYSQNLIAQQIYDVRKLNMFTYEWRQINENMAIKV